MDENYIEWKGWVEDRPFGYCDAQTQAYFQAELRTAQVSTSQKLSILEIGFGNGEFADFCKKAGYIYSGTEINSALVAIAKSKQYSAYLAGDSHTLVGPFDLIVAFDVLEHLTLDEIRLQLLRYAAILRPHGKILARLPSGDSPFARAIQHGDLTHQTTLGSSALRQLASQLGLSVAQIREPAFLYRGLPLGSLVRRSVIQLIRSLVFPVCRLVFFSGAPVVLTQNQVVVLQLKS